MIQGRSWNEHVGNIPGPHEANVRSSLWCYMPTSYDTSFSIRCTRSELTVSCLLVEKALRYATAWYNKMHPPRFRWQEQRKRNAQEGHFRTRRLLRCALSQLSIAFLQQSTTPRSPGRTCPSCPHGMVSASGWNLLVFRCAKSQYPSRRLAWCIVNEAMSSARIPTPPHPVPSNMS
jgi:hypothetical protein